MRYCTRCKQYKPDSDFYSKGSGWCKSCRKAYSERRYYFGNYQRKYMYGISTYQLYELFLDQEEKCAICGAQLSWNSMHVDHNHLTNTIRGLLCKSCNNGIGFLKDDPVIVEKALAYLVK